MNKIINNQSKQFIKTIKNELKNLNITDEEKD
jgi:hypothetical protein